MEPHAGQRLASPAPQFKSKRLIALGTALLFLPAALLAQQAPYYPGPQQPGPQQPNSQQYEQEVPPPPDEPQSGYDQPQVAPAPETQLGYSQQVPPPPDYSQPQSGYDQSQVAPAPEIQPGYGQQTPPPPDYNQPQSGYDQPQSEPQPGYTQQQQPLNAPQLEQLVAPIAINPDSLIALQLAASTYPSQVAAADQWRQAQGNASPDQIAYGASLQAWDPSVKALTAFPQVLDQMAGNFQWTAALGAAYYNQPQDVLQAIQIMRQRAQAAGNLQSSPQETVTDNQGYIAVAPANPQVVYVPQYDPWAVYGQPVAPYPGFAAGYAVGAVVGGAIQFGVGTVVAAFTAPFNLLSWGLDWLGGCLLFDHGAYYSHSHMVADWGLRYGGPRAWGAPRHSFVAYNHNYGYGRGYGSSRGYGYQSYGRNYGQSYRAQNGYGGNLARPAYGRTYQSSASGYRGAQALNRYGSGLNSNYRGSPYSNYRQQSPFANHSTYGNRTLQAYNRNPEAFRSQQYSRGAYGSTYGSGFASTMRSSNDLRRAYGSSYQGSRSPYSSGLNQRSNAYRSFSQPGYGNRGFNQQSSAYRSFSGNGFANYGRSSRSSGGFFGGGNHSSFGSGGSFKTPHFSQPHYSAPHFSAPKMHGGGGGGGHFGGGGGGHFGGGGGGHHGGGGGGGHHR